MIRVEPQPAPPDFDDRVRKPGAARLEGLVQEYGSLADIPSSKLPPLWRACLPQLHEVYAGICAYVCHWIPRTTGSRSADHYVPKSADPAQAYSWENYRLACGRMNARKHVARDVLDPFEVQDGWFWLEFYGFQVRPARDLEPKVHGRVTETIERLCLNDYACRRDREQFVTDYLCGEISHAFLRRRAPLIARELARQGRLLPRDAENE